MKQRYILPIAIIFFLGFASAILLFYFRKNTLMMTNTQPINSIAPLPTNASSTTNREIHLNNNTITIRYTSSMAPEKIDDAQYTLYRDAFTEFFVSFFKSKNEYMAKWPSRSVDSDGVNAAAGEFLIPTTELLNGNTYQRYVEYYNPLGLSTKSTFDAKISTITRTYCVSFLPTGGVIQISPISGSVELDACAFVKEHNVQF